jgi:hypothetical protein
MAKHRTHSIEFKRQIAQDEVWQAPTERFCANGGCSVGRECLCPHSQFGAFKLFVPTPQSENVGMR